MNEKLVFAHENYSRTFAIERHEGSKGETSPTIETFPGTLSIKP